MGYIHGTNGLALGIKWGWNGMVGKSLMTNTQLARRLGYKKLVLRHASGYKEPIYVGYGSTNPFDRSRDGKGYFVCWASELNKLKSQHYGMMKNGW